MNVKAKNPCLRLPADRQANLKLQPLAQIPPTPSRFRVVPTLLKGGEEGLLFGGLLSFLFEV